MPKFNQQALVNMIIKIDDLQSGEIISLLDEHLKSMLTLSPAESVHALDVNAMKQPSNTFFGAWINEQLAGCGALKDLSNGHGEIKSMKTSHAFLRQGVAANILEHIIAHAEHQGFNKLSLETGTAPAFLPAQKLYQAYGFKPCAPFANYLEDEHSLFMTLTIKA